MKFYKVLWVEDSEEIDLYDYTNPVKMKVVYDLEIAKTPSEAIQKMQNNIYDAIVVDIRLPPGKNTYWERMYHSRKLDTFKNADRLGLEMVLAVLDKSYFYKFEDASLKNDIKNIKTENRYLNKFSFFSIELKKEVHGDLPDELRNIRYTEKTTHLPRTALLTIIENIIFNGHRPN